MAGEQLPVTPDLIKWARERAGYSIEEAAQTFQKIEAWESGKASPTYSQLEHLASTFKLPIAVFFFPEPPEVPPINETFRTLPDATLAEIPRRIRLLLRKAKALQLNLLELYQEQNPAKKLITRDLALADPIAPDELARRVRDYIGVDFELQVSWATDDEAFKEWRKALLNVGIFVFKDAFKVPEYSGFCLYDDLFPIIYVNNSVAKTRQIFTLFHELAHLLFQTSGVDTIRDSYLGQLQERPKLIEILCNRFAAEFLIPNTIYEEAIKGLSANEETASTIASQFHVSREVIFRKFLDRGLIDQSTYLDAAVRWARQRNGKEERGVNPYWTKIAYLGREYIDRALRLYHQNRIDQTQLGEYLDWKPRNLDTLEEYFSRGIE
jgi:Zn-dependent peptidase ImmA (M78 family)